MLRTADAAGTDLDVQLGHLLGRVLPAAGQLVPGLVGGLQHPGPGQRDLGQARHACRHISRYLDVISTRVSN